MKAPVDAEDFARIMSEHASAWDEVDVYKLVCARDVAIRADERRKLQAQKWLCTRCQDTGGLANAEDCPHCPGSELARAWTAGHKHAVKHWSAHADDLRTKLEAAELSSARASDSSNRRADRERERADNRTDAKEHDHVGLDQKQEVPEHSDPESGAERTVE